QLRLQEARGARKNEIRRRRRDDDQVEVRRGDAGRLERLAARFEREVAGGLRFVRDVALADARSLADPFVARIELLRQVVVGDDPRRQIAAGPGDARMDQARAPAMRSLMRRTTSFSTSSTAASSACPNAWRSAEPWLLMTMPFSPRRLAPL